ncbi:unnamed protein product [Symbiodinium pilosum]|uniref:Cyclic nucleotide-binding domain-containing protein n=1 Tax=Symbiodinium pilosum TaxID=2952 RepID=A0A812MEY4_SYMPI|nr:unnamed protein product [Symbiodinium pilosum]
MARAPRSQNTSLAKKRSENNLSLAGEKGGLRLLDDWSESFVVSEEDAIVMYNNLYSAKDGNHRMSSVRYGGEFSYNCWAWLSSAHYCWQICTLVLVVLDTVLIPLALAWPSDPTADSPTTFYFQVGPGLWSFDIFMSFVPAVLQVSPMVAWSYLRTRFPLDVGIVVLDMVLLLELIEDRWRALTLLRLTRIMKFRGVMIALENRLAAKGNMKFVLYLTIFQCIAQVLAVNHVLACVLFYAGRFSAEQGLQNWIDEYNITADGPGFQYMKCFNWAIAQYTPAPFPYQPQNEYEQSATIVIILTCLPLLGAQIGKIGGTLNLLKEKAKERDTVRRDLQRWLFKTHAPEKLTRKLLDSLTDVLESKDSPMDIKEPIALKFLPSTLLEELHIVKTGQKLAKHQFFHLLMDDRVGISGRLSAAFKTVNSVQGEDIFQQGKRADGLFITGGGQFIMHLPRADGAGLHRLSRKETEMDAGIMVHPDEWLAELCLYANMNHSACLTARTYSKVLKAPVAEFVKAIQESPGSVVAVHEYALRLLLSFSKNRDKDSNWEFLPPTLAEDSVQHTQLADLLNPGMGRMHSFKSSEETDFTTLVDEFLEPGLDNTDLVQLIKRKFPELREDSGIYALLQLEDEAERAVLSLLSTIWIMKDDYKSIVDCQKPQMRLTQKTFMSIQEFLGAKRMNSAQLTAAFIILALRGLSKSEDFAKLCPPSQRRTPEQVLSYATTNLDAYLPSMACLRGDAYDYLVSTVRMLDQFNFAQLLQGENNPHSVWQLQCSLQEEGAEVFQIYLFVQVSILCGVTGAITLRGSMFLSELNGRSVLKGLASLQDVSEERPQTVYWRYIASRAQALHLEVRTPSHLVLARLACLTRTVEPKALQSLADDWDGLTDLEKDALYEVFLTDGLYHKAFIFLYLPLFLTNAVANQDLGLRRGLQFLVELYTKLVNHRCLNQEAFTVKVDISSLASLAKEIDDFRLLRLCLDYSRIVKHAHGVTVLLTAESYQILSGQLVAEDRSADLLERLSAQQLLGSEPSSLHCKSDRYELRHHRWNSVRD